MSDEANETPAISIHALREEGDYKIMFQGETRLEFLSTPSVRRATRNVGRSERNPGNFYPRPPRGGRLSNQSKLDKPMKFLSTPSARRATIKLCSKAKPAWNFYPRPP